MSGDELATAGDHLSAAAENIGTDEEATRLSELADQLHRLADADHGPDHGRLARIQAAIDEIQPEADDDVAATLAAANDAINEYREDLEGV